MGQLTSKPEDVCDGLILRIAAKEGHTEVVEMYLHKNPALALHVSSTDRNTVVQAACEGGQHIILQQLLSTLQLSAASNTFSPVRRMLDLQDSKGRTALLLAAAADTLGHMQCAASLVQAGCSVWLQDRAGCSSLHHAALQGRSQLVELLLQAAAQQQPAQQQHQQVHPSLQQNDARALMHRYVNLADAAGRTALHYAVQSGDLETIHHLTTAGACLTAAATSEALEGVPVNKGATPLHLAAIKGDKAAAVLILAAYVAAAAGALPEVTQPLSWHCTQSRTGPSAEDESKTEACRDGCSCCDAEAVPQLQDPRTVRDAYGLTPHAVTSSGPEMYDLRQLLNPNTIIAEVLEALPDGPASQQGSRAALLQAAATAASLTSSDQVAYHYKQVVRALNRAGMYLARHHSLQEEQKQALHVVPRAEQLQDEQHNVQQAVHVGVAVHGDR